MTDEARNLKSNKRALDVLNKLFEAIPDALIGIHAARFRADNYSDIRILKELERYGFIEDRDEHYRLKLISVICLAEISPKAASILRDCEKIYNVSKNHYSQNLTEPISLNEYSKLTGISRNDLNTTMRYFRDAHIFGGIPNGFPDSTDASVTISESVYEHENFQGYIDQQKSWSPPQKLEDISSPRVLPTNVKVILQALAEARSLEAQGAASSAVDRVHTAFHAFLKVVCDESGIEAGAHLTTANLFKLIKKNHPAFENAGPRAGDVARMLKSLSTTIDAFTPIRNKASLAHGNDLLDEPEALAVINSVYTVFRYMQDCLDRQYNSGKESE